MSEQLQVKVSWKLGNVELQYEGNEDFLKTELPKLFQELLKIYKSGSNNGELESPELPKIVENPIVELSDNEKLEWSVNTIGAKIGVKKGPDLVKAACAYLTLVQEKGKFARQEILDAMITANHYYTDNHNKSLSRYIKALVRSGFLLERSKGVYAIEGSNLNDLRATLVN